MVREDIYPTNESPRCNARSSIPGFPGGILRIGEVRISDLAGERRLPIGDDGFERAVSHSVFVDKSLLIRDVLERPGQVTLFCRPRRFGKTLAMTMLKAFFEIPADARSRAPLFEGLSIWDADDGRWRQHQGAYPVIYLSLKEAKWGTWDESFAALSRLIADEYSRHGYLAESSFLDEDEKAYFRLIRSCASTLDDLAVSLARLAAYLRRYHCHSVVILIDEYDAPVMAGYTCGYYREVVSFVKSWLTGALKDGGRALAFACLTGVQRISKESIFSDLNNLVVSTPLHASSDERFGLTGAEVRALAGYLGQPECYEELKTWYDGYRFGDVDIFNPWSVLRYLDNDGVPGAYWANTSSNDIVGQVLRGADDASLGELFELIRPGGTVAEPLDLSLTFPDIGIRPDAVWPMLYLAGYLTTDETQMPDDPWIERPLRIPNGEIRRLFSKEIYSRFLPTSTGSRDVRRLHRALRMGQAEMVAEALGSILRESASYYDLLSENSYHMLMLGLCFGAEGYACPVSNREAGEGRFDIQLLPDSFAKISGHTPTVTIELKVLPKEKSPKNSEAVGARLGALANEALVQIATRGYDGSSRDGVVASGELTRGIATDPARGAKNPDGRLRYGIAFCGRRVAVSCERVSS